ncbi:MAG: hypothetical protein WCV62_03550 [Candidatus Peribacteraceae bacterium]|jgi:hypothetical protein
MDEPSVPTAYKDEDLVYVDPDTRTVVGLLEWSRAGNPKPKLMPEGETEQKRKGPRRKRYYPWGTYKSMKRVYQLEGKLKKTEGNMPLDDAMQRAAKEAFWD